MKQHLLLLIILSTLVFKFAFSRKNKKLQKKNNFRTKVFPYWIDYNYAASFLFSRRLGNDIYYKMEEYNDNMKSYVIKNDIEKDNFVNYIPKVTLREDNFPPKLFRFLKYIFKHSKLSTNFFPDIYYNDSENDVKLFKQKLSTSQEGLRDFHNNEQNFLPKIKYERPICPIIPEFNENKDQFFKKVIEKEMSNQQRWHCYSLRFRDKKNTNLSTGYAEITPPVEENYNEVSARIVYNYVEKKIYYSPYHYRPYYCTDKIYNKDVFVFQKCYLAETYLCPFLEICQNPYFNIIEEDQLNK